jgi:thiol:disulfide interchange protein DsbC
VTYLTPMHRSPASQGLRHRGVLRYQRGASTLMTVLLALVAVVVGAAGAAVALQRSAGGSAGSGSAGAGAAAPGAAATAATATPPSASASAPGEATIRAAIASRIPDFPKIDEVTESPIPGIFELRFGTDILYADGRGTYLLEGNLIDTATRANLTAQRVEKLTAIDFAALNKSDAIVWKTGTGARQVAVFADPNCGYCKRFERELTDAKDVTVYTYLIPILGPDSNTKTRNLWCAKDRTAAWRAWMLDGKAPATAAAECDTKAIERNLELARKHRVNGTPALVFEDGKRVPGAMPLPQLEQQLAASTRKS